MMKHSNIFLNEALKEDSGRCSCCCCLPNVWELFLFVEGNKIALFCVFTGTQLMVTFMNV